MAQQLSIFLENAPGRLAALSRALGEGGFNMYALSLADTSDYGVARIFVDRPASAKDYLEQQGFSGTLTEVCAVEIPDEPGSLGRLLELLSDNEVNIAYSYVFVNPLTKQAINVFKLSDPGAVALLEQEGYRVLDDGALHA
ncbi:MAG: amino acid-binding protein [Coriobacteriia bacterium]|nr:amino acid-binding protein [Coriobacteriia bacterium]